MKPPSSPDISKQAALRRKSLIFAGIAVVANVSGNAFLRAGMHQIGPTLSFSPLVYVGVLRNPLVVVGIFLLAIWFFSNLFLLSWADLSYVLPVTATGYAIAGILGWAVLGESISLSRWLGIALITFGAAVVARTKPHTTSP